MKIRIRSTPDNPAFTEVIDAETGQPVPYVFDIQWSHKVGEAPTATLHCYLTEIDVETKAEKVLFCPACRAKQQGQFDAANRGEDFEITAADVTDVSESWRKKAT